MEQQQKHILVCLSTSPSSVSLIHAAAAMAQAYHASLTALFVQTSDYALEGEKNQRQLRQTQKLAKSLGAKIETVYGDDVAYQIAAFSRVSHVTMIVIGRGSGLSRRFLAGQTLVERLIHYVPDIDVHVAPEQLVNLSHDMKKRSRQMLAFRIRDVAKSVLVLSSATAIGYLFYQLGFTESNIITVYILGVLLIAVLTEHRIYSLVSSIVSVLVFNFLFTEPRFSLQAYDSGYPITFLIMFIAAFLTGSLAVKLKNLAKQSARTAYRSQVLFDTNQLLQKSGSYEEIWSISARQLVKLLNKNVIVYIMKEDGLSKPQLFLKAGSESREVLLGGIEYETALWTAQHNRQAGALSDRFPEARCLYLAVRIQEQVYGVIGIELEGVPLETFEHNIVLSILGECALAMENRRNAEEKEKAAILAKNEQLRANLLRSISHDLRTPLTSISGNASNLMSNSGAFDEATKQQIYTDIFDDASWLINLVENLLAVTRIEDGRMQLHLSAELVDEVIAEALRHVNQRRQDHHIEVKSADDLMLAKMDARLIVQVLINLIDNALKYTPSGAHIEIRTARLDDQVQIQVADDGPGIAAEQKEHIFEMFYSGHCEVADSRRSLGLGLALCRSVIRAHGGEIMVSDNQPKGTIFTFTLPAEEVQLHE